MNAIEINHLTKTYGKNRGVNDLVMLVQKGDIYGFLGPNGAGKSTTIRSLLGLIHFQSGSASILGMDVVKNKVKILERVGYMPSEAMFYPSMKVADVIRLAADLRGKNCGAEAAKLCERLQVDTHKKIEELSLGNRKKVSIVCAMQHRPELFIFDEPTSGLDPLMQNEFFKLIEEYNREGTTCFLSSHVLSEIKAYCNNVAIIREGRLIRTDSVENLTKTKAKNIRIVRGGVEEKFVYKGDINEFLIKTAKEPVDDIIIEEPSLDEIFMHYYQGEEV